MNIMRKTTNSIETLSQMDIEIDICQFIELFTSQIPIFPIISNSTGWVGVLKSPLSVEEPPSCIFSQILLNFRTTPLKKLKKIQNFIKYTEKINII